jgi:predicted nucleic acid-binding protein
LIVVSDTSPILNLARIGRLELLPSLYRRVLNPSAVFDELAKSKSDLPPAFEPASTPWLIVATALDQNRVRELRQDLDAGEAEAIVLAIERRADLVLVDERRGRRTANAAGLTVTGLLGVVARAKQAGLIKLAKPLLDELIQVARFWIGPDLYAEVLADLDEG